MGEPRHHTVVRELIRANRDIAMIEMGAKQSSPVRFREFLSARSSAARTAMLRPAIQPICATAMRDEDWVADVGSRVIDFQHPRWAALVAVAVAAIGRTEFDQTFRRVTGAERESRGKEAARHV